MSSSALFETDRLRFRHLELSDLDDLARMYADPEMRRHYPDGVLDRAETERELRWFMNGHPEHPSLGLWATVLKDGDQFIGRCGLLPWDLDGVFEVEVAYMIDKDYWGQGFGTEAAAGILRYAQEELGLRRLVCLIEAENAASVRVAERIGMAFEREGTDAYGPFHLYSVEA